ncbi:MAG TPA: glycosyltransferase family A protein [Allosphingosinicella sp.]|nr:glycosyltransferase family A protein [Allosphingosinicella sp.]
MAVDGRDQPHGADLQPLSEADQRRFFEAALERTLQAESRAGTIEQDIALLGETIRLRFAGQACHDAFMPALAHLAVARVAEPGSLLHIWDTDQSGVAMAPAPCPGSAFTYRGDIWTMLSRRVRSAFQGGEASLSLLDVETNEGIYWTRSARDLPYWTKAAPLRAILNWWIVARGGQFLHGAAFGNADGGLLLTGKGGVGKSTTALQCLAAGFDYAGDDYVAVTGGEAPAAHSIYCTAKVNPSSIDRFAAFKPRLLRSSTEEKAVAYLFPEWRDRIVRSLPIKAVLTPEIRNMATSTIEATPRQRLLDAASFTTIAMLPHSGQDTIRFVERLLDRRPGYVLGLGSDPGDLTAALTAFLREPQAAVPALRSPGGTKPPAPLVSVVIPVFNGAHFLADAIGSVLAQGHEALDVIVVDDGSLDDIDAAVAALPIEVRLLKQPHAGPAAARNTGVRNAAADYIAFLDVDDLWSPGKIKASLDAFETNAALDVVIGQAQLTKFDPQTEEWIFVGDAQESFPFHISAAVFRSRAFQRIGLFDEQLRFAEDTDWFTRAGEAEIPIERLDRPTLLVRRHDSNMTFGQVARDLTPARLLKNLLDRRRAQEAREPDPVREA